MRVTDIITKVIELRRVASKVDGSTKTGLTQLYQLSNRIKDYIIHLRQIVLSPIYEITYEVNGNKYFARITNVTKSEAKGVVVIHCVSLGVNTKDIHFLEIKRIPTFFSEN